MLIEILLLNSRQCSTYDIPNPSRGPLSVCLFFSLAHRRENLNQNVILSFLEDLRMMMMTTSFMSNI